MVADNVLAKVPGDNLAVHVVWMPVLPNDDHDAAVEYRSLINDPRAVHYWNGDQILGQVYGRMVRLPGGRDLAWDIYFLFDAGIVWEDEAPMPTDWFHRLGEDEKFLGEGDGLHASLEELVKNGG